MRIPVLSGAHVVQLLPPVRRERWSDTPAVSKPRYGGVWREAGDAVVAFLGTDDVQHQEGGRHVQPRVPIMRVSSTTRCVAGGQAFDHTANRAVVMGGGPGAAGGGDPRG